MPRRRPDQLLPLELDILATGIVLQAEEGGFHGFLLASRMAGEGSKPLTAHGTLYKALARMTASGMLESSWEDPAISEREGRPRRRLYRVTGAGSLA
ncbi:MAG: helix-turn-helix transcriptional regulator, partial [Protaetiibacter sp.]